ncbi:MAG: GPI transamidase component [Chaenotheca gracillima]|nr:MAG: GPI transamidase component [Chaenotheca gracillima]
MTPTTERSNGDKPRRSQRQASANTSSETKGSSSSTALPAAAENMTRDKTPPGTASAKKHPPPESSQSVRTRTNVILSWWSIVVVIGLPIWWMTTSIYRAKLPLPEMMEWADGKILVDAPLVPEADALHLLRLTQHALDDLNDFAAHHLRLTLHREVGTTDDEHNASTTDPETLAATNPLRLGPDKRGDAALLVRLLPGESGSTPSSALDVYSPTLDVLFTPNQIPSASSTSSPLATYIANTLQEIFTEEQAMVAHILSSPPGSAGGTSSGHSAMGAGQTVQNAQASSPPGRDSRPPSIKSIPADLASDLARRTTRSFKYSPTYHLTFSLFTPNASPSSWEIKAALEEHFASLLESLAPLSNFTIDTQVQLYASSSPTVREPEFDPAQGAWTLRPEDLSGFINAAEWPLSPGIGEAPTINFILYVPSPKHSPLVVGADGGLSWLIPQWGGVKILNPAVEGSTLPSHLPADMLRAPLLTYSHQLLSLLGTPRSPASLPLRLLTLTRVRSASLILSASSTLGSLARLTLALPSISIPRSVAESVDRTISHLNGACSALGEGKFHEALEHGRIAEAEAERGFFEKSMVGQVYFPDEHKVAIYLPLLGPVGVPLVMGAVKEFKRLWKAWKGRV